MPEATKASRAKPQERKVMTLRLPKKHEKLLHEFSPSRSRKMGKNVSYNDCLLALIETVR